MTQRARLAPVPGFATSIKGAILSHGNLVANIVQIATWIGGELKEGVEVAITPLPLFHIFSLTANLLTFISIGGHNLLITDPCDITARVAFLRRTRFTARLLEYSGRDRQRRQGRWMAFYLRSGLHAGRRVRQVC